MASKTGKKRPAAPREQGRSSFVLWGVIGAIIVAVLAVGIVVSRSGSGSPTAAEGTRAPSIPFLTFDGQPATFADFRGKPLVVNFYASWCPPCVAELPGFAAVDAEVGDRVTFIGIALQDDPELAQALEQQTGIKYPTFQDQTGAVYQSIDGFGMPTTVFIDAEGNLIDKHTGILFEDQLRQKIDELFPNA
jgi:thiol-disulfide isomerase/thioredoxin